MEHQDSSGCRECSNGNNFLLVARRSARCSGGPATAAGVRPAAGRSSVGHGPAYEGDETRQLVLDLNMIPVVPPKSNRRDPWDYDRELYKKRNQIERLFRRLKGFRRIFSRFEKLDVVFLAFIYFAFIIEALR
jgi:transposase